ncbi:MAG: flippase-like domain-containing protein [Desulfobacca sp.]|uniref:flippase-like domain-containing protein n=1 Tax=Desulfobacca sp. TaxID=2067990 RepID=UPI00404ADB1B
MGTIKLLLLLIAGVSLVWMLQVVGWPEILRHLKLVGWYWPLVLLPYLLVNLCDSASWYCCFERFPPGITMRYLFFNRLAGEAINVLTPMASLGGEPVKAMMLQNKGITMTDATASLVISKGILVLSMAFYIILGMAVAPFLFHLSAAKLWALVAAGLALILGACAFVVLQRYGMCRLGMAILAKCRFLPKRLQEKEAALCRLDAQMSTFYRQHLWRFWLALILSLFGWLVHSLEVYLIFALLGQPIHLLTALCLDALATLITSMAFFIPGNLGVQDGGNILLAIGLQLGALMGATFSLIRRLREGFWLAVGLAVLAIDR